MIRLSLLLTSAIFLLSQSAAMGGTTPLVLPDGKALVNFGNYSGALTLFARINPDGSLDSTFGNNGKIDVNLVQGAGWALSSDYVLHASGKLVVSGGGCRTVGPGVECTTYLARYGIDGGLDTTFGDPNTPGRVIFQDTLRTSTIEVFIQGTALIAVRALIQPTGAARTEVRRFSEEGKEDPTFGNQGVLDLGYDRLCAILRDGRLLATHAVSTGAAYKLEPYRMSRDGQPDASFDGSQVDLQVFYNMHLVEQPDGKLLFAGASGSPGNLRLMRLNTDGGIDLTFGTQGSVQLLSSDSETPHSLATLPDGSILVGGSRYSFQGGSYLGTQCLVAKFDGKGTPDPNFGAGGYNLIFFNPGGQEAVTETRVGLSNDGSLFIHTRPIVNGRPFLAFAKLEKSGNPDSQFGTHGIVLIPTRGP